MPDSVNDTRRGQYSPASYAANRERILARNRAYYAVVGRTKLARAGRVLVKIHEAMRAMRDYERDEALHLLAEAIVLLEYRQEPRAQGARSDA